MRAFPMTLASIKGVKLLSKFPTLKHRAPPTPRVEQPAFAGNTRERLATKVASRREESCSPMLWHREFTEEKHHHVN